VADAPETVTEALDLLEAEGYRADVEVTPEGVRWSTCGHRHPGGEAIVEHVFRFEGESDPADEAIVFGLRCPTCGQRGTLVSAYGPDADPAVIDHLVMLGRNANRTTG